MGSDGLIGYRYHEAVHAEERVRAMHEAENIVQTLKKRALTPTEIFRYCALSKANAERGLEKRLMLFANPHLEGKRDQRQFKSFVIELLLQDDLFEHFFSANHHKLEARHFEQHRRLLPLAIKRSAHLAKRKVSNTKVPFYYNEKFMYVIGAAILLHTALNDPRANPMASNSVILPTTDGFYVGDVEPIDAPSFVPKRSVTLDYEGHKQFRMDVVTGKEADDLPTSAIKLRTTIKRKHCVRNEGIIHDRMRAILAPLHHDGTLRALCDVYGRSGEPYRAFMKTLQPSVDNTLRLINSDPWIRREAVQNPTARHDAPRVALNGR